MHRSHQPLRSALVPYGTQGHSVGAGLLARAFADLTGIALAEVERRVVFLDARRATDPESRGYAGHTGEHPFILWSVAAQAKGMGWFKALRLALHSRRMATETGDLHICFVCKSGKHRSVAMAFLVQRLLRASAAYIPGTPTGFLHWGDLARCRGSPRCRECGQWEVPQVQAATDLAMSDWNAALQTDTPVEGTIF